MIIGFPCELIPDLRCTHDGEWLECDRDCNTSDDGTFIRNGVLRCTRCGAAYTVDDGILNMLASKELDEESLREIQLRNEHAGVVKNMGLNWWDSKDNQMEMVPTLGALSAESDSKILELGCGDGRYTVQFADKCRSLLALDFSVESLRILQQRLQGCRHVGLVLGDVTTIRVSAGRFDRVFSTLVSNLPTRGHRDAMYRLACHALNPDGRFVFSTHHHGIRQRLAGEEKSGLYHQGGIYRYNFTVSECREEVRPYFRSVHARPIQVNFPFARTLRLPVVPLSLFSERVPLLNLLGMLVLCVAEGPLN